MDSTTSDPQTHQLQAPPQPVTSSSSPQSSSPSSPQSSYNSSFGSNSGRKLINNSSSSITSLVPGGVVTTQNISTVIRPKGNNNSLQFVKIQTPELSKKAVEQIRIAEERNISKEKIKEVEEEWQNNLLNWKSKRRQQLTQTFEQAPNDLYENTDSNGGRKIKTFAEMLEERAKSGNRLGFHLQRYLGADDDNNVEDESQPLDNREEESFSNGPMNSSPRHDLRSPPNTPRSNPLLDVDTKTNEVSAKSDNDSDNSVSEEEEEDEEEQEEEEQKQLQRIAFEAKLKAFEKLTMPTTQKPEIAPKRITRVPIPPPKSIPPPTAVPPPKTTLPSPKVMPQPKTNLPPTVAPLPAAVPPPPMAPQCAAAPQTRMMPPSIAKSPSTATPPPKTTPSSIITPPSTTTPPYSVTPPSTVTSTSTVTSSSKEKLASKTVSPPRMKSPPRVAPQPKLASLPRETLPPKMAPPPPANLKMREMEQHMPKNRCLTNQPALESPKNNSSQRKSRDDKDRTVLSVSGKKRCSSCKEELGRGAAAFVVESLALVYHTNCFKCSVCHVNLSNGFRGVDVRVHAGALHCQNCYSKDGLNYSRV